MYNHLTFKTVENLVQLIPIIYHHLPYPSGITSNIQEVAAHFDIEKLNVNLEHYGFSLHTEYSAVKRKFTSDLIQSYSSILASQSASVRSKPKLWLDEKWVIEFADFIVKLLDGKIPRIIEIHPPNSRKFDIERFLDYYELFQDYLTKHKVNTEISIENRNGFMLSGINDFQTLSDAIDRRNSNLRLILDFPQLLNFEKAKSDPNKLVKVMSAINGFKHNVSSFHIWGQYGNNAHRGDLLDYFNQNNDMKNLFYEKLKEVFSNHPTPLYFIPEINFGIDENKSRQVCLKNIVDDLLSHGFKFISKEAICYSKQSL